MIKDFKKYLKHSEYLRTLYKEKREKEEAEQRERMEVSYYLKDHTFEEAREHFKDHYNYINDPEAAAEEERKTKIFYNTIKEESIKNDLLYNNFIYKLLEQTEAEAREVIEKYKNKSIGEKTAEKIAEEIKTIYNNIDIFKSAEIYVYFSGSFENNEISLTIREAEKETYYNKYDIKIKYEKKTSYNCYEDKTSIFYYTYTSKGSYDMQCINDLLYIEDPVKEAKNVIKEHNKIYNEVEKTRKQIGEKIKTYNNYIYSLNLSTEHEAEYKQKYEINTYIS